VAESRAPPEPGMQRARRDEIMTFSLSSKVTAVSSAGRDPEPVVVIH